MRGLAAQLPYNRHVLILALDTSSASGSLAVLRDKQTIGSISTWTEETYSSRMFRQLDFLLRELSLSLDAFDLFAVTAGPGSFTGLRVGLAAVKGWAEVYRKPIAAVSALEAVAAQSHLMTSVVIPVLDARRGQVYFGIYRRAQTFDGSGLALEGEERVATPHEFAAALKEQGPKADFAVITPVPSLIADALSRFETARKVGEPVRVEEASSILAPEVGRLGYFRAQRGELTNSLSLDANYVRRSDAELHWKEPK